MKLLLLIFLSMMPLVLPPDFFKEQLQSPRVAKAYASKGKEIERLLRTKNIHVSDFDLFLRAFKNEEKLEVWVKNKEQQIFTLLRTYQFCVSSGTLGPKRQEGDLQIPEGCYRVTDFNPKSTYHLSFKIDYPNKADLFFAHKQNPGSDIFIHGKCVSIGCISIGDEKIEELYLIAAKARNAGGNIYVHIFPTHLKDNAYKKICSDYASDSGLLNFWANLKPVYESFEQNKTLPIIKIDASGKYQIKK